MTWWQTLLVSVVPVIGVLAGTLVAQRGEGRKRLDERAAGAQDAARQEVAAVFAAEELSVLNVLTSGVAWRSDIASLAMGYRFAQTPHEARARIDSMAPTHLAFGTAVQNSLVHVSDERVRNALHECARSFDEGFDIIREVTFTQSSAGAQTPNYLNGLASALANRLAALQNAMRDYLRRQREVAQRASAGLR